MSQLPKVSEFPADVFRLENGLTVIHQYISATPVAVVDVWVRAGAIREPNEWSGMAHFLEHMIFKGTDQVLPGVFDQIVENRGGVTNAATSHDYAHFFITTAVPYLADTLPYLAELLLNASIPADEFSRERDVVLEEIRQAQDNPDWLGFQALMESVYECHPYGRPVLGTEMHLLNHSPEEMRSFHSCHYQPENMTVVIVGGVDRESALDMVEQSFQQFATRSDCRQLATKIATPLREIRRQELCLPSIKQARLMMAWAGPGVEELRSGYGLDLISALLGDGRSSRLVKQLREEEQLVSNVSSSFSLQQESSLFTISAWLEPQYLQIVEGLICSSLAELHSSPMSEAELKRSKRLLCNDYAFSTESPGQLAGLYGYYNTIAEAEIAVTYPQQIQGFQALDLQQLAQQYLSPERYAVTILKPND
ncbi:M16 family metallopeptidase [Argonema antarcticum]|uniref:M16 family metallopeptidase n=1 Tax=Argonema antarcticum TaxID=2942763 RepID=UPI0020133B02|nr:pitrilysin family protein [Argonema antarcticum]MCL1473908.1 insulinase family protein [Argonema antarcticum A004/B2]